MKFSTARIKEIIKEELFYREFYRNASSTENHDSLNEIGGAPAGAPSAQTPVKQKTGPLGQKLVTKSQQARGEREKGMAIQKGETLGDVTDKERSILVDVEKILTAIAEKDDLNKYRTILQTTINTLSKKAGI